MSDPDSFTVALDRAIALRGPSGDEGWREWQAHTFMRHVLMPKRLLVPMLQVSKHKAWAGNGGLYDLRDRFGVTISALVVHLRKLGVAHVDKEGMIHDLGPEANGQQRIRF